MHGIGRMSERPITLSDRCRILSQTHPALKKAKEAAKKYAKAPNGQNEDKLLGAVRVLLTEDALSPAQEIQLSKLFSTFKGEGQAQRLVEFLSKVR